MPTSIPASRARRARFRGALVATSAVLVASAIAASPARAQLTPAATAAPAAEPSAPPPAAPAAPAAMAAPVFIVSGMISASVFAQDAPFTASGQSALYAASQVPAGDAFVLGGDVRNTRVNLTVKPAPSASGFSTTGVLEVDFFGGFAGSSAYSDEQPSLRLRLAYVDLTRGATTLRLGQAAMPISSLVPVSVSRLAVPYTISAAGTIGWRAPGAYLTQRLSAPKAATYVAVTGGVFRGSWSGPGNTNDNQSAGEASGIPEVEARVDVRGILGDRGRWELNAAGHYDRKDLSGIGPDTSGMGDLEGRAAQVGGRLVYDRVTVQGNLFRGHAIAQVKAALEQFGAIHTGGGYGQVGVRVAGPLSLWALVGMEDPDDDDVRAAPLPASGRRLENRATVFMARYAVGPYALGAEWLRVRTRWDVGKGTPVARRAQQVALSVMYAF